MPKKQTEWSREYNAKAYDRIYITVPKGVKEIVARLAASDGKSLNGLINDMIESYIRTRQQE